MPDHAQPLGRRRRRPSARSSATRCPTPAAPTCARRGSPTRSGCTATVFDGAGEPIPDAIVEIWGADAAGRPVDRARRLRPRPARLHGLRPRRRRPRRALLVHDDQARRDPRRIGALPARDRLRARPAAPPLHPGVLRRRGRGQRAPIRCSRASTRRVASHARRGARRATARTGSTSACRARARPCSSTSAPRS